MLIGKNTVIEQRLYNKTFCPTFHEIKITRAELEKILVKLVVSETNKNKILLALSEYLTNLVKHAQPQANEVTVSVKLERHCLFFSVCDDGGNFSGLHCSPTKHPAPIFAESGMGVDIIFHLFPLLKYNRVKGLNVFEIDLLHREKQQGNVIAVIDDEAIQREILTSYLSSDYCVVTYKDGQEFLANLSGNKFDLVICDVQMPIIDGLTVKSSLLNDPLMSQIPFIFLTGNKDPKMEICASELGIDNYLIKPISKEKLLIAIERVFVRNRQLNQLSTQVINDALKPNVLNDNEHYLLTLKTHSPEVGGGDFVVQKSLHDKTFIILADVMGHDVTSKLFAHSFDGYIKGLMTKPKEICLANIFTLLSNRVFNDPLLSRMLLTCIGVELNDDHINIVSSGHASPMLLNKAGIHELDVVGRLPGICDQTSYTTRRMSLKPGERLLLFTDGFFDWVKNTEQKVAFKNVIMEISNDPSMPTLEQVSAQIYVAFETFCDQPDDDMTFIILEKK